MRRQQQEDKKPSMMRVLVDSLMGGPELKVISKEEFRFLRPLAHMVQASHEKWLMDMGFFPLKKVYVIQNEDGIGANESDPQGSYVCHFLFSYNGIYYQYYDQG